jgi:hypothetical protein
MIVPQISRLRRTRIADGVSSLWVGVSLATNLGLELTLFDGHGVSGFQAACLERW